MGDSATTAAAPAGGMPASVARQQLDEQSAIRLIRAALKAFESHGDSSGIASSEFTAAVNQIQRGMQADPTGKTELMTVVWLACARYYRHKSGAGINGDLGSAIHLARKIYAHQPEYVHPELRPLAQVLNGEVLASDDVDALVHVGKVLAELGMAVHNDTMLDQAVSFLTAALDATNDDSLAGAIHANLAGVQAARSGPQDRSADEEALTTAHKALRQASFVKNRDVFATAALSMAALSARLLDEGAIRESLTVLEDAGGRGLAEDLNGTIEWMRARLWLLLSAEFGEEEGSARAVAALRSALPLLTPGPRRTRCDTELAALEIADGPESLAQRLLELGDQVEPDAEDLLALALARAGRKWQRADLLETAARRELKGGDRDVYARLLGEAYHASPTPDRLATARAGAEGAVAAAPDRGDERRALLLNGLARLYRAEWQLSGNDAALRKGILTMDRVLEVARPNDRAWAMYLHNRGSLQMRAAEAANDAEIAQGALPWFRDAVVAADEDDIDRCMYLYNLASCLLWLYQRIGNSDLLTEAGRAAREAVDATPPDYPQRAEHIGLHGAWSIHMFDLDGNLDHLRQAVSQMRTALASSSDESGARTALLVHLGQALERLARATWDFSLRWEAIEVLRAAAREPGRLIDRIGALQLFAGRCVVDGRHDEACAVYRDGVDALSESLGWHMDLTSRSRLAASFGELPREAASVHVSKGMVQEALYLLEAGRALILGGAMTYQGDLVRLAGEHPSLARRLDGIRSEMVLDSAFDPITGVGMHLSPGPAQPVTADRPGGEESVNPRWGRSHHRAGVGRDTSHWNGSPHRRKDTE